MSVAWVKTQRKVKESTKFTVHTNIFKIKVDHICEQTHRYSIYVCVPDAGAEVGAELTACEPVSCGAASAQPCSFHHHSSSHCSAPAPGDWTENGQSEKEMSNRSTLRGGRGRWEKSWQGCKQWTDKRCLSKCKEWLILIAFYNSEHTQLFVN